MGFNPTKRAQTQSSCAHARKETVWYFGQGNGACTISLPHAAQLIGGLIRSLSSGNKEGLVIPFLQDPFTYIFYSVNAPCLVIPFSVWIIDFLILTHLAQSLLSLIYKITLLGSQFFNQYNNNIHVCTYTMKKQIEYTQLCVKYIIFKYILVLKCTFSGFNFFFFR